jgi:hypothetical protein
MICAGIVQTTKTDAATKKALLAAKRAKPKKTSDEKKGVAKKATGPDTFTRKAKPAAPERPQFACRGVMCRSVARKTWDIARTPQSIQHIGWSTDGSMTIATQRRLDPDTTQKKLSIKVKNGWIFYKRKTDGTWKKFKTNATQSALSEEQKAVFKIYERGAKFAKKMRWMIKTGFSGNKLPVGFSIDKRSGTVAFTRIHEDSYGLRHQLVSTMTAHMSGTTVTYKVSHHTVVDGISTSFPATFTFRASDLRQTSNRDADRDLYASGSSHASQYSRKPSRTNTSRVNIAGKRTRRR